MTAIRQPTTAEMRAALSEVLVICKDGLAENPNLLRADNSTLLKAWWQLAEKLSNIQVIVAQGLVPYVSDVGGGFTYYQDADRAAKLEKIIAERRKRLAERDAAVVARAQQRKQQNKTAVNGL